MNIKYLGAFIILLLSFCMLSCTKDNDGSMDIYYERIEIEID